MNTINDHIANELRNWITEIVKKNDYNTACENFLIQHSIFYLMSTTVDNDDSVVQEWTMRCTIYGVCEEGLYDIDVVYSDVPSITVSSHKGNYESFEFEQVDDYIQNERYQSIYARDLYPNFEMRTYTGKIITRGGFSGWNYKDIPVKRHDPGNV